MASDSAEQQKPAPTPENLVVLGVVVRPHGVRGELRVKLFNPESELLQQRPELFLRSLSDTRKARVIGYRPTEAGYGLLVIAGCGSREGAEALRGVELCVARANLPRLNEGEYYFADLTGLLATNANGDAVGVVQSVISYPAADVLLISAEGGLLEVPMREPYLRKVDLGHRSVVVDHLEDIELQPPKKKRDTR